MTLGTLKPGMTATVVDIDSSSTLRRRLMELGLTPGTSVSIIRMAPMGDPIEIMVRGFRLSLRMAEAALIRCIAA